MTKYWEAPFVWTGGALFVGSLALTAWLYGTRFAEMRAFVGWQPAAVNAIVFTLFAFHHSLFAREQVKRAIAALVPERLLRSVYVWIASGLLTFVGLAWQPVGGRLYAYGGLQALPFVAAQALGLLMIASAVRAIRALELAGIRPPAAHERLQTGGVYSLVRHPLYLGWVLIVWCAPRMTGDRLTFAVITTMYLIAAVPWEERSLERHFGDEYRRYRKKVRWRIVPGVY